MGLDPILRALKKVTQEFVNKLITGENLPLGGYADDHMAGLQVRGVNDVQKILMVYEDFHKVSGLQVNLKKNRDAVHKHRCKAN